MIIVDTSVAIKWLRSDEQGHKEAMEIYINHIENVNEIVVPSLFYIEAANALATSSILSSEDIAEGISFLFDSRLHTIAETKAHVEEAALLAKKYKTSVYDMLYAVIAKSYNATLITADKRFAKSVDFSFVKLLE